MDDPEVTMPTAPRSAPPLLAVADPAAAPVTNPAAVAVLCSLPLPVGRKQPSRLRDGTAIPVTAGSARGDNPPPPSSDCAAATAPIR